MKILPILAVSIGFAFTFASCTSTDKKLEKTAGPIDSEPKITPGNSQQNSSPMPNVQAFWVKRPSQTGKLIEKILIRTWDFDQDGYPDMVEEFDANGQIARRAFDFDRNGKPDRIENAN